MLITKDTKKNSEFTGNVKTVTSWRTWLFSGGWPPETTNWPAKNIHTDLEFARSCGVQTLIASGNMAVGYLTEFLIDLFGEIWFREGKMSLNFVGPIKLGEKLRSKAVVQSKVVEDSGVRLVVETWCENQHGDKLVVGTGTCLVE